jgi:hypothetical protein
MTAADCSMVVAKQRSAARSDPLCLEIETTSQALDETDPRRRFAVSRVYTDLPRTLSRAGGVLQDRVTQPEWSVYDSLYNVLEGADGVVLAATCSGDDGLLEWKRWELNLHANPEQRRWHAFAITVPPG